MINSDLINEINIFLENQFLDQHKRLVHIRNVVKVSLELGKLFSVGTDEIIVSALLHDATKNYSFKQNYTLARKYFSEDVLNQVPNPCLHAYSAAALAKIRFKITDENIINAITYHCSGRMNMSDLEKIIFIGDFIEESRDFVNEEVKIMARQDLDKCVYMIMCSTKAYLEKNNQQLSVLTQKAIAAYEEKKEGFND